MGHSTGHSKGHRVKIAAATYPIDRVETWAAWDAKVTRWVEEAARAGAELLVFPEYGAMELAAMTKAVGCAEQMRAVAEATPRAWDTWARLARDHDVHILAPSGPVRDKDAWVNRAMFFAPNGKRQANDKRVATPWEVTPMGISAGHAPVVMETKLGVIGVLICYDCEFPLAARAMVEAGVEVILVPSATETRAGFHRVRIGAQARALEGQIVTVQSPTQGQAPWCDVVDENHGAAGVYVPPDTGLPETGILAQGEMDRAGWTIAEIDLDAVAAVRATGGVRTRSDWPSQLGTACAPLPAIARIDLR